MDTPVMLSCEVTTMPVDGVANKKKYRESGITCCKIKYSALALISIIYFFIMVNYESPSSLQTVIMSDLSYSAFKFSILLSTSSLLGSLSFLGGLLTDKYLGLNRGLLLSVGLFCLGSLLYTVGMYIMDFSTMNVGRILSGWSGEVIFSLGQCYILLWFSDGGMNTAFAATYSFSLLEPSFLYQISTPFYMYLTRIDDSLRNRQLAIGHVTCLIMSMSIIVLICSVTIVIFFTRSIRLNVDIVRTTAPVEKTSNSFQLFRLSLSFWLLNIVSSVIQTAYMTFISMSQDFFVTYYKLDVMAGNNIIAYSTLGQAIGLPLIGILIDKTGNNFFYMTLSCVLSLAGYSLMLFQSINPIISVAVVSVSICLLYASSQKLIGLSVKEHQLGTAFGMCYSLLNGLCGVSFALVGAMTDYFGIQSRLYFFISLSSVALIVGIFLLITIRKRTVL